MDKVQQQLQEYRRKKLQQGEENSKTAQTKDSKPKLAELPCQLSTTESSRDTIESSNLEAIPSEPDTSQPRNWTDSITSFLVQLLVWLVVLLVAVKVEFGTVYCVATGFYIIWRNLSRSRRRPNGELSAYSVFNPNCERLPGTLTAEQLEGELLHRPM